MSHHPTVLKFGGTSVADARAFERVRRIIRGRLEQRPVVVVSAMSGVTDALLASAELAGRGEVGAAAGRLDPLLERHRAVADALLEGQRPDFERHLEDARGRLGELLRAVALSSETRPRVRDSIAAYGERLAAALLAAALRADKLPARYVDARRCVVTDDRYGNARPLIPECKGRIRAELEPLLAASEIPVLGGFIGATARGETTTLGRNGSDYTSALVGGALRAREIQIWTDVAGVMTTDPRIVRHARTVRRLSYAEAARLASFGAKVIYPQAIRPAAEEGIPIRVLSSYAPEEEGTLVWANADHSNGTVKAIAHKGGFSILHVDADGAHGAEGFVGALFEALRRNEISVEALTASESGASLAVSDAEVLPRALDGLSALGPVNAERGRAIICLVGEGLLCDSHLTARVFNALGGMNAALVSHGASRHSLLLAVPEEEAVTAVTRLHDLFF